MFSSLLLLLTSSTLFSLSNQLSERDILILFRLLQLLLMIGLWVLNYISLRSNTRSCSWVHGCCGYFGRCFLHVFLNKLLLNLIIDNVKGSILPAELITILSLPVVLLCCKDVKEAIHVHAVVQVKCLNLIPRVQYWRKAITFLKSASVKSSKIKSKLSIFSGAIFCKL